MNKFYNSKTNPYPIHESNPVPTSREQIILLEKKLERYGKVIYHALELYDKKIPQVGKEFLRYLEHNTGVITNLISEYSKEYGISKSTIRWNTKILRNHKLIICGDESSKGIDVTFTDDGDMFLNYLKGVEFYKDD